MKKTTKVLITGATGFLGTHILKFLLGDDYKVFLLIRGNQQKEVEEKKDELIKNISDKRIKIVSKKNIMAIRGDVSKKNLGIEDKIFKKIIREVEVIYHCSALTGFRLPLKDAIKNNLEGTKNVLKFASACRNIKRVNYISTAFIVGTKKCIFKEDDNIEMGQEFNNTYERSKYEAELLVQKYKKQGLKISIFRPSIIAGEYWSGRTTNFKMFYEPLHFFSLGIFDKVPANPKTLHNLIPVDIAAKAIYLLGTREKKEGVYHIVSSNNDTFRNFMKSASNFFGYRNPRFISQEKFNMSELTFIQKQILEPFLPYLNYEVIFENKKTQKLLKKYSFTFPKIDTGYYRRLFKFCSDCNFIKKKI